MRNWLKKRKNDRASHSDISLPIYTEKVDIAPSHSQGQSTEASSLSSVVEEPPNQKPPSAYVKTNCVENNHPSYSNKNNNHELHSKSCAASHATDSSSLKFDSNNQLKLLTKYFDSIPECNSFIKKKILISSEHYFRLALESYEQLQVVHYTASKRFTLAEWLHIHALLLYGRVQQVQLKFDPKGGVAQHNKIDLSGDIKVFSPIATALSAIGGVEDKDRGIIYIPDAILPEKPAANIAYSSSEMEQILNGTLYDWQRSWKRVLEARSERECRDDKFTMKRSESELMTAIRDISNKIERIREKQRTITEKDEKEEFDIQLATKERNLSQLFEEARNVKDYTMLPPCSKVYNFQHKLSVSEPSLPLKDKPGNHSSDLRGKGSTYSLGPNNNPTITSSCKLQSGSVYSQKKNIMDNMYYLENNTLFPYGVTFPHNSNAFPGKRYSRMQMNQINSMKTNTKKRDTPIIRNNSSRLSHTIYPDTSIPSELKVFGSNNNTAISVNQRNTSLMSKQHSGISTDNNNKSTNSLTEPEQMTSHANNSYIDPLKHSNTRQTYNPSPVLPPIRQKLHEKDMSKLQHLPTYKENQSKESTISFNQKQLPQNGVFLSLNPSSYSSPKTKLKNYMEETFSNSEVSLLTPPDTSIESDITSFITKDDDSYATSEFSIELKETLLEPNTIRNIIDTPTLSQNSDTITEEKTTKGTMQNNDVSALDDSEEAKSFTTAEDADLSYQSDILSSEYAPSIPEYICKTSSEYNNDSTESHLFTERSPLMPNKRFEEVTDEPENAITTNNILNSKKANRKVTIGGSSDSLDQFVHYDAQLWTDYMIFVSSLEESHLAAFEPIPKESYGDFSWMLPVQINYKSPQREITIKLPFKSVTKKEQILALILQTCYGRQAPVEDWHNEIQAQINLREFMTEYVATAVDDRTHSR